METNNQHGVVDSKTFTTPDSEKAKYFWAINFTLNNEKPVERAQKAKAKKTKAAR
jgi:hypothetical protein